MKKMRIMIYFALIVVLFLPLIKADGFAGYMDRSEFALHEEDIQVAAINYENGIEKLLLAIKFEERNNKIFWIVPIPAKPSEVKINIFEAFPEFRGSDIIMLAEEKEKTANNIAKVVALSQLYTFPFLVVYSFAKGGMGSYEGVEVYGHIEKEGIVTELVTADNADAIYNYLKRKGIEINEGSLPAIQDYMGKEYSFVISWIEAKPINQTISSRTPAIFVEFPCEKIYYPLKPTSAYGDAEIPVLIYIIGFADTDFYKEIKDFSEIKYFQGRIYSGKDLSEFYKDLKYSYSTFIGEINYTRITIGALEPYSGHYYTVPEAKNFVQDLSIEPLAEPPKEIQNAFQIIKKANNLGRGIVYVSWLLIASLLSGALTGLLLFRKPGKFALIGLSNLFSIVGLAIATSIFAKDETGKKRVLFIFLFSVFFLIIDLFVLPFLFRLWIF